MNKFNFRLSMVMCLAALSTIAQAEVAADPVFHFPPAIESALDDGVNLQVILSTKNYEKYPSDNIIIGNATIKLLNKKLIVSSVDIQATEDGTVLNEQLITLLKGLGDRSFDSEGILQVSDDAIFTLDGQKMQLKISVSEAAFGLVQIQRNHELGNSSVGRLTTMLDYNLNAYSSRSKKENYSTNATSGYLNLKSTTSIGEGHLVLSGSVSVSDGETEFSLDDAMYEHDMGDRRLAVGKLSGWSMQTLASVSSMDSGSLYGFSYGNKTKSSSKITGQSISPIVVYMPSSGEARILRDGRLLDIQRLSLGSHELDTTRLPGGVYDVTVEIVVGGSVLSTRVYRVNKSGSNEVGSDTFAWEVWGGGTKADKNNSLFVNGELQDREDDSWGGLYGLSMAARWKDLDWNLSLYRNRETEVQEAGLAWQISTALRANLQNLYGSDGSRRMLSTLNAELPANLGSVWYTRENGKQGRELNLWARDYDSVGTSLSLGSFIPGAGSLSLNYEKERNDSGQAYLRADYNQMVYSGENGTVQLQLGMNRNTSGDANNRVTENDKYIALNFNVPLGADFNVGITHEDAATALNLGAGINIEDSAFNYIGADVNIPLSGEGSSNTNFNVFTNYAARYGSGTISLQGGSGDSSVSISNQGSISLSGEGIAAGNTRSDSGIVINVPEDVPDNKLEAVIDGQPHILKSGKNLISLPSFSEYKVTIRNSVDSEDSYNVLNPEKAFTLYPGNIAQLDAQVNHMVTIFGRLTENSGKPLANVKVHNHIGATKTDNEGNFSIDVNRAYPELVVNSEETGEFNVDINLNEEVSGAVWVGDLKWQGAKKVSYTQPSKISIIKD